MSYIGNAPVIQSTEFREEYFPTASQTAFVTGGFHPSAVSVTRNGVLLSESDYTKGSDNVTITLNSAAVSGDVVVIRGNRSLAQGVSVSESRVEYTWQANDTVVQLNADVIPAYTDVYLNGVKLAAADYTIDANAKTVSFGAAGQTAPAVGDVIAVVHRNETSALVALPLKDSAGNSILSEASGVVSIGSGVQFPTGHVVRTLVFNSGTAVTNEVDQFLPFNGTSLSVQIPNYTYGNTLLIWATAFVIVQENAGMVRCSGYYKTGGSLGSPATPSTGTWTTTGFIGYRKTSANTLVTRDEDTLTMLDSIELSGSGTTHLDYAIYADFGASASEVNTYKKRLFIQEIQG